MDRRVIRLLNVDMGSCLMVESRLVAGRSAETRDNGSRAPGLEVMDQHVSSHCGRRMHTARSNEDGIRELDNREASKVLQV